MKDTRCKMQEDVLFLSISIIWGVYLASRQRKVRAGCGASARAVATRRSVPSPMPTPLATWRGGRLHTHSRLRYMVLCASRACSPLTRCVFIVARIVLLCPHVGDRSSLGFSSQAFR